MTEIGSERAAEAGLTNVSFRACDFHTLDVAAEGSRAASTSFSAP